MAAADFKESLSRHLGVYLGVVLATAGLILGLVLNWPLFGSLLMAAVIAFLGFTAGSNLKLSSPKSNLITAISLYLVFLVSALTYLGALAYSDGLGRFALWLLSDTSHIGANGVVALGLVLLISAWVYLSDQHLLPSLILLGVSVGLLGPLMLVGYLVPSFVKRLPLSGKLAWPVAGLLGGITLSLVSTSNYLLLGGYAPALVVPLGFVSIPLLLWLCRSRETGSYSSIVELLTLMIITFTSLAIVWHLVSFAQKLS